MRFLRKTIYSGLVLSLMVCFSARAEIFVGGNVNGNPAFSDTYNNNQIQLQNASQNQNQVQVNSYSRTGVVGAAGAGVGGSNTVIGSPSAFANTHMFNAPWNFTAPNILFHASKTINDGSPFGCCRVINVGAPLRRGLKDRLFGIYDEREFIASGAVAGAVNAFAGQVIACGLNTELPAGCVTFVGSGYVFMEEYATTEASLVALSRMAARNGANILGNVNCAFAETIRSYSTSLGASAGFSDGIGKEGAVGGSVGGSWSTSRVKRPVQPHCSGDFYVANMTNCSAMAMNQTYFPQPVAYRRYLPPTPPMQVMQAPPETQMPIMPPPLPPVQELEPIRGLW